ncbi:MAG: DUF4345 family protein [Devosia sp.]|uniref:DUF4345 family protein n=1 Tax=Devosia sp. TaxID=1871048 RepID=UPI0024C89511|nr:DUF4345 family protein [Devosia sp.]UYO00389.1 MAG: DUF4345 family protein [Devosia sp.]
MAIFTRLLLAIGALTAAALALSILFLPVPFYSGYGIAVGAEVSLLNELKAPALLILALGLIQAVGLVQARYQQVGVAAGLLLYLSFGLSRLVAILTDGPPSPALIWVAVVELTLGGAFALALWRLRRG